MAIKIVYTLLLIESLNLISDIPIEILITVGVGIVLLFAVCIVALLVRRKCQQADLNNQAIYNQSTVSSSGGYATTKPHTRSSWTCTYKAGHQRQVDTHIWETLLPEPSTDEYTLPTNMRQPHNNTPIPAAMLDSMEYTVPVSTPKGFDGHSLPQAEYTKPQTSDKRHTESEKPSYGINTNSSVQDDKRQSQANYYYYDPSSGEQSEYMAPASTGDTNAMNILPSQSRSPDYHHDVTSSGAPRAVAVTAPQECAYRTLIRLEDSSS